MEERLLEAGRRALERWGWGGATVERIASEAGLSRVTLHRRGVGKDEILAALLERALDDYRRALWPPLTGDGTGAARLRSALEALCDVAERHLAVLIALQALSDALFHESGNGAGEVATRAVFVEPLARLVRDGIADGTLKDGDADELATVAFNVVGWSYLHLRSGHRWAAERARRRVVGLALDGLAT